MDPPCYVPKSTTFDSPSSARMKEKTMIKSMIKTALLISFLLGPTAWCIWVTADALIPS